MKKNNDNIIKTLSAVTILSLVCSIIVSISVVCLRDKQKINTILDKQYKILEAAGIDTTGDISTSFNKYIEPRLINLNTGEFVIGDADSYNLRTETKDPQKSIRLSQKQDIAHIIRRPNVSIVYFVKKHHSISKIILPIYGHGLWSMMYALIALEPDGNTISKLIYYKQRETPGLGGEITNPLWSSKFIGKKIFSQCGTTPSIKIIKNNTKKQSNHNIDGLSGATLTSNGVQNTFDFWFSDMGFGAFLHKIRNGVLNDAEMQHKKNINTDNR